MNGSPVTSYNDNGTSKYYYTGENAIREYKSYINIFETPSNNSKISSQVLYGEEFKILSKRKNWVKIKTSFDNYIGFIKTNNFY